MSDKSVIYSKHLGMSSHDFSDEEGDGGESGWRQGGRVMESLGV